MKRPSVPWTASRSPDPYLSDRRRSARHRIASPATLIDESTGRSTIATLSNVSLFGLAVTVATPLDIRGTYRIEPESPGIYLASKRTQVISCRKTRDGRYEVGMEFVGIRLVA